MTAVAERPQADIGEDNTLLIVDDDEAFCRRLARAMEKRGFAVETAESVNDGRRVAEQRPPAFAVIDLRLGDGNGLDVVEAIRGRRDDSRVIILTGYGAIAGGRVDIPRGVAGSGAFDVGFGRSIGV